MVAPVEIEIDGPCNENLMFRPISRSVRGRFDFMRIGEPMAKVKAVEWVPIPSQRLGINDKGVGYILEPLHDPEHEALRSKIEKMGYRFDPPRTTFTEIDYVSWMFWLKAAVDSGLAKITVGELPTKIEGFPRKNFILAEPEKSSGDKLTAALEQQTIAFNRLTDALLKHIIEK